MKNLLPQRFKFIKLTFFTAIICAFVLCLSACGYKLPLPDLLHISKNDTIVVPNLVNMTEDEATKLASGFLWFKPDYELEIVAAVPDENVEPGRIISQEPEAGEKIEKGSVIKVVISIDKSEILSAPNEEKTMPSVVYMSEDKARQVIEEAGCSLKVEYDYSDTVANGMVIKQSVKQGEKLTDGQEVTITVSRGAKPVATPKPKTTAKPKKPDTPKKTQPPATPLPQPTCFPEPSPHIPLPTPPATVAPLPKSSTPHTLSPVSPAPLPTPFPTPPDIPHLPGEIIIFTD